MVLGWTAGWLALVPTGCALALAARCRDRTLRLAMLVLPLASAVVWAVAYVLSHTATLYASTPPVGTDFVLLRYSPVPVAFLAAGLLLTFAVERPRRGVAVLVRRVVQGAGVAVLLYAGVLALANPQSRDAGPLWSEQVAQARMLCATGDNDAATLNAAPASLFAATIPCEFLRDPG